MVSETLHFENARLAMQLVNNETRNFQVIEERLKVKTMSRDGWIKLEGEEEDVLRARTMFEALEHSIQNGGKIRDREFTQALDVVCEEGGEALKKLLSERIVTSTRKAPIVPKTVMQQRYVQAIRDHVVTLGLGPAGTGKTYLAMAMATAALKAGDVARIILTRPAVEAGEALGFLPGDLYEKLDPYLRPLHDALNDMLPLEEVQKQKEKGAIEIAPLAYMRGRTLNNAFIILDEAQNSTTEQMFMFLTRLGFNSKCVVTGDPTQIDLPLERKSGLLEASHVLKSVKGISVVEFGEKDVVRHPLVRRIIRAYAGHRAGRR